MKKKIIVSLLTVTLFATLLSGCSGCGNKASETVAKAAVVETTESIQESEAIEESEVIASEEIEVVEAAVEDIEEAEIVETEVVEVEETEIVESQATEPETEVVVDTHGYTYTNLDKVMYAKSSVNVRDLPSTEGNKVDRLSTGQEVKVTGQCNETGWYRLEGNKFVSNNYLVDNKPAATTPSTSDTTVTASEGTASACRDFLNHLNSARKSKGLNELSWDSGCEAEALRRSKEIVADFSHNGSGNSFGENIHSTSSSNYVDWYNAFYNSPGHYNTMFAEYSKGACAFYTVGGRYYVVFVATDLQVDPASQDGLDNDISNGNAEHKGGSNGVDVYGNEGVGDAIDPSNYGDLGLDPNSDLAQLLGL